MSDAVPGPEDTTMKKRDKKQILKKTRKMLEDDKG